MDRIHMMAWTTKRYMQEKECLCMCVCVCVCLCLCALFVYENTFMCAKFVYVQEYA